MIYQIAFQLQEIESINDVASIYIQVQQESFSSCLSVLCKPRTFPGYQLRCPLCLCRPSGSFDLFLLGEMLVFMTAPVEIIES